MGTKYIYIYLCHLQYLLLTFCSFQCTTLTSLVKFTSRYFILFAIIVNEIVFLIFLLIVYYQYIETTNFSQLSSAKRDSYTSFFPILMPFISFSCLIALARISSTMLHKSGESGHPCLVTDFRGKAFSFSPLRMMLAVSLSYVAFIMLRYVPSLPSLLRVFNPFPFSKKFLNEEDIQKCTILLGNKDIY